MPRPTLTGTLEMAALAWAARDFGLTRDAAATAVSLDPVSIPAHHYLAAALGALGEADAADRTWHEALALAPDDVELLLGTADHLVQSYRDGDALDEAVALAARGLSVARQVGNALDVQDFILVLARARLSLGDARGALAVLAELPETDGVPIDRLLQEGLAFFELVELDDARDRFEAVTAAAPDEPMAWWYLGLIAEREGQTATRYFERARRLDPEGYGDGVLISEESFDAAVESALRALPHGVAKWLENVAVLVEPIPADDDLLASDPPLSPTILGLFRGPALPEQSVEDPWSHFPASIVLFQRNLERSCTSREELLEQIEVTLLHEVGHYLGLDEAELEARGLE